MGNSHGMISVDGNMGFIICQDGQDVTILYISELILGHQLKLNVLSQLQPINVGPLPGSK